MKYDYKFDEITFKSGRKKKVIIVSPKIRLIADFLMSDIQGSDPTYVFNAIDNVLSGKSNFEEIDGNVCGVEIRKDFTTIYDNLDDDSEECKIETIEFRKFVELWLENRDKV